MSTNKEQDQREFFSILEEAQKEYEEQAHAPAGQDSLAQTSHHRDDR